MDRLLCNSFTASGSSYPEKVGLLGLSFFLYHCSALDFICFLVLIHFCSHAQVFGRTLMPEFRIFYSHTKWNLVFGRTLMPEFRIFYSHTKWNLVFGRTLMPEFHIFYSHTKWNLVRELSAVKLNVYKLTDLYFFAV